MGHAVYTLSDPRAELCLSFAERLAANTPFEAELQLLQSIERLAPQALDAVKGPGKTISANVDMYSGLIYTMLGVPEDLFTPLFACGRMAGWAAHRFEEIVSGKRIIRPAYKTTGSSGTYIPLNDRG
jgi:citrate synthase